MSIKYYGKSQEVCESIIKQFESGNLPEALKNVFVKRSDNVPSASWSWSNQFLMAIMGTNDARGFRQWETAGRKIKKGTHAIYILGPCLAKIKEENKETGEKTEKSILYGFKSIPVFKLEDTEVVNLKKWETAGGVDTVEENRLKELPLRCVADKWELNVTSYNGENANYAGYYSHSGNIAIGVKNLSTWCHELVHAADHKNKTLTIKPGQQQDNEIVAELGGAVLLKLMGYDVEADLGGAWEYVKSYAKNGNVISLCMKFITRICECVNMILTAADEFNEVKQAA